MNYSLQSASVSTYELFASPTAGGASKKAGPVPFGARSHCGDLERIAGPQMTTLALVTPEESRRCVAG